MNDKAKCAKIYKYINALLDDLQPAIKQVE